MVMPRTFLDCPFCPWIAYARNESKEAFRDLIRVGTTHISMCRRQHVLKITKE